MKEFELKFLSDPDICEFIQDLIKQSVWMSAVRKNARMHKSAYYLYL